MNAVQDFIEKLPEDVRSQIEGMSPADAVDRIRALGIDVPDAVESVARGIDVSAGDVLGKLGIIGK